MHSYLSVSNIIIKHCHGSFPLYRPSISNEKFLGKSRVELREFKLLIYPIAYLCCIHYTVNHMNNILITLTIYITMFGGAR